MKIIIATDGSEYSRAAIEKACQFLDNRKRVEIKIISVYQGYIPLNTHPQLFQYAEEFEQAMKKQAQENADEAVALINKTLPEFSLEVTTLVRLGANDRVIVETAEEWNADLIVVGSHGRGFWGRALIGSVSDSVIHHAPCSVLIVRKTN